MKYIPFTTDKHDPLVQLFNDVFTDAEGAGEGKTVADLVQALLSTTDNQELYGFIAEENDRIVGAILFSRFTLPSKRSAFILSPVAISTDLQGRGIGQKLIHYGIEALSAQGVEVLLTYGDPNYYCKTGFKPISEALIPAPLKLSMPQGWLAQSLTEHEISPETGQTQCVAALNNQALW